MTEYDTLQIIPVIEFLKIATLQCVVGVGVEGWRWKRLGAMTSQGPGTEFSSGPKGTRLPAAGKSLRGRFTTQGSGFNKVAATEDHQRDKESGNDQMSSIHLSPSFRSVSNFLSFFSRRICTRAGLLHMGKTPKYIA